MDLANVLILMAMGLFSGLLAGVLGLGGGIVLVPMIKSIGYNPVQAFATSSLAIIVTSLSGSIQNWRMGKLDLRKVISLSLPSLFTAQIGVIVANYVNKISPRILLLSFGCFLIINIFLANFRKTLIVRGEDRVQRNGNKIVARFVTGGAAGLLAGLFGIGGGVILVPLQMILLAEKIKSAIQISLGVIVITSISACLGHAFQGNILFFPGIILGFGGLIGAQISTRFLPRLPNKVVTVGFNSLLVILAIYIFYQGFQD